mgnify:CR=1 FL=1
MNIWSLFKFLPLPWSVAKQRSLVESPLSRDFWILEQNHQQKQTATNLEHRQQRQIDHLKRQVAEAEAVREKLAQEIAQLQSNSPLGHGLGLQTALAR